jgi:CobQ-like glutamine amidotransferase family enzyme
MWIVSKSLKFAALYPNHLDLNGDHGNLIVLQKRLLWRGVQAEIFHVEKPGTLEDFDFVLLGHGTKDAWAEVLRLDPELLTNLAQLTRKGKPVMAISSGYEYLIQEMESAQAKHAEHVSEFRNVDEIVGYINTAVVLPEIRTIRQTALTLFHGPVLAKNPGLADKIISAAGWCDVSIENNQLHVVDELAKASRRTAFED